MPGVAKRLDAKGRLVLGREYANATVLVEKRGEGEFIVKTAAVVPVHEAWLFKNKEALKLVQTGLDEIKKGNVVRTPLNKKDKSWIKKLED
ncbi:MAG: hypothetical protein HY537_02270 [Deltaproteobacteria bacterium]|nr:hypothetical protein [Deltaproteobacteria bacterium]